MGGNFDHHCIPHVAHVHIHHNLGGRKPGVAHGLLIRASAATGCTHAHVHSGMPWAGDAACVCPSGLQQLLLGCCCPFVALLVAVSVLMRPASTLCWQAVGGADVLPYLPCPGVGWCQQRP
jgi:hypothetical protein